MCPCLGTCQSTSLAYIHTAMLLTDRGRSAQAANPIGLSFIHAIRAITVAAACDWPCPGTWLQNSADQRMVAAAPGTRPGREF